MSIPSPGFVDVPLGDKAPEGAKPLSAETLNQVVEDIGTYADDQVAAAIQHADEAIANVTGGGLDNRVVALGEVSGAVNCDLSLGRTFEATCVGDTNFHFVNWPAGLVEASLRWTLNGAPHTITVPGVTDWPPEGVTPLFDTAALSKGFVPVLSTDKGVTVFGLVGPAGPKGLTGADGIEGPRGEKGSQGDAGVTGPTGPPGATGATETHGEVLGTLKIDLRKGLVHTFTQVGDLVVILEHWGEGTSEPELWAFQDAVGNRKLKVEGVVWQTAQGTVVAEPSWNLGANALNIVPVASPDAGTHVVGFTGVQGVKGTTGTTGTTGATGPQGSSGGAAAFTKLLTPMHGLRVVAATAVGTAFKAYQALVVAEATGILKTLYIFNGNTVAGETRVAVFDTGQATSGKYKLLGQSAAVAPNGTNKWQAIELAAGVPVVAGQALVLSAMSSATTHQLGFGTSFQGASNAALPASVLANVASGMGVVPWVGAHLFGSLAFADVEKENFAESTTAALVVMGKVE